MSQTARRIGSLVSAVALLVVPAGLTAGRADAAPPARTPACSTPLFPAPVRAAEARTRAAAAFREAAARNGRSEAAFARTAADRALWLDRCGQGFYVEPAQARTSTTSTTSLSGSPTVPLADTFTLESRPGSTRTIYLDFDGGTVTNTGWNADFGSTITVDAYSSAGGAAFSDDELLQIQRAWQVVAEDYAPFDVNVTLRDPGNDAIDRASSTDMVFGTRAMVTNGGPIYTSCGCGGMAYLNAFSRTTSHAYYQPAFVFSDGTTKDGKYMGEAISHEVGHNFGLNHDGTATSSYYSSSFATWGPIMGSSYGASVSQWSRGEYSGANNTEDDLAIIAASAPVRADDHGDTAGAATALAASGSVSGVIGTRSDVDAFTFSAEGGTTVDVQPTAGLPDLDVQLRIVDRAGAVVANVAPTGLAASWTGTLSSTAGPFTAYVDGVGTGDPLVFDQYSDYASLGAYRISLSTGATVAPLSVTSSDPGPAVVGSGYTATPVVASGGTAGYTYSAAGLPAGLSIAAATGQVSGVPTQAGTFPVSVNVTDGAGATAQAAVSLTVKTATSPLAFATSASLPGGRVGRAYSTTISVTGGSPSYTWSRSGSLPAGLTLTPSSDGRSAVLGGTPTTRSKYSFTLTVTDGSGTKVARKFSVSIGR